MNWSSGWGQCDDTLSVPFLPNAPSSKGEYNLLIDRRWSERLALRNGDVLTAREMCLLIRDSTGAIKDIYREQLIERTEKVQEALRTGIVKFLE